MVWDRVRGRIVGKRSTSTKDPRVFAHAALSTQNSRAVDATKEDMEVVKMVPPAGMMDD